MSSDELIFQAGRIHSVSIHNVTLVANQINEDGKTADLVIEYQGKQLFARAGVPAAGRDLVERVLRPTGELLWIDAEKALDAVTAVQSRLQPAGERLIGCIGRVQSLVQLIRSGIELCQGHDPIGVFG